MHQARTYFYDDETLFLELRRASVQFNMAMSYIYSFSQFVGGHKDFLLGIGRTRMRDNLRRKELVNNNLAFSTSLLDLVTPGDDEVSVIVKNEEKFKGA